MQDGNNHRDESPLSSRGGMCPKLSRADFRSRARTWSRQQNDSQSDRITYRLQGILLACRIEERKKERE